jgi:hypothetical protein
MKAQRWIHRILSGKSHVITLKEEINPMIFLNRHSINIWCNSAYIQDKETRNRMELLYFGKLYL